MNYEDRDSLGMYRSTAQSGPDQHKGPGPELMGADTLVGNDVFNLKDEDLGDIKEITLDLPKDKLKDAPGFDKSHWPNMADQTWAREIRTFYTGAR